MVVIYVYVVGFCSDYDCDKLLIIFIWDFDDSWLDEIVVVM